MSEQPNKSSVPLISKAQLPRISFPGKVHLILNDQQLLAAFDQLRAAKELGFDTETRPAFKKGEVHKVALLQLSTDSDAFVIRLHVITQFGLIKEIFEDEQVLKVGVAIRDDLKTLQKTFSFTARNFTELQTLAKTKGMQNFGLKGMTEEVMQMALSKGPKLTNWEARELTPQQIMYAATDAWIGLTLFRKLSQMPDRLSVKSAD